MKSGGDGWREGLKCNTAPGRHHVNVRDVTEGHREAESVWERRPGNILLQEHHDSFLKLMEAEAGTRGAGRAAALMGMLTMMGSKESEAYLAQPSSFRSPASGNFAWGKEDTFQLSP